MSELKVNKISPRSGTDVTLGDSGDAISVASGASLTSPGLTLSDNILFNAASKGIYLGVTSATAANLLDDYEEGTWIYLLHQAHNLVLSLVEVFLLKEVQVVLPYQLKDQQDCN
jgi:hypothetical protein